MKKGLLLFVAILACFALAAQAAPVIKGIPMEGGATVTKAPTGKAPAGAVAVGPMGYADAWRTVAANQGKSIVSNAAGTSIQVLYSQNSGTATPSNLTWGYSDDGGATWSNQTIVSDRNSRTYAALAVDANFTPYIVWQDRIVSTGWPISLVFDEGGYGGGLWSTAVNLTDSGFMYLPGAAIQDDGAGNFNFFANAFPHSAFGGDASLYLAHNKASDLSAWTAPWDLSGTWGWNMWVDAPDDDQDAGDMAISPSGDTIVAFTDFYQAANDLYFPGFLVSYDNAATWSAPVAFGSVVPGFDAATGSPYQYNGGGWWYRWDAAWIGQKPYLLFTFSDNSWNGLGLFIFYPTTAGDYSAWTCKRISEIPGDLAGVVDGDLVGSLADYPGLASDAAGNIFAIYKGYTQGSNATADVIGVASTDGGDTWLSPVYLTNYAGTPEPDFIEVAELAGGDLIHMIMPTGDMDSLYYINFATAPLLAAPARSREIDLAPLLVNGAPGGPVDATLDSVLIDTVSFIWGPMVALNGQYELTISKTADWSDGANIYDLSPMLNTNYVTVIGLPSTGVWYYKVRSHFGGEVSPWSVVNDFEYVGTATNTTDWVTPSGVEGKPTTVTHPFVLGQNRPNPVNGDTKISFSLRTAGEYSLKVYNVTGQVVSTISGRGNAGNNTVTWNSKNASNGVYFYQLNAAGSTATRKMIVVK